MAVPLFDDSYMRIPQKTSTSQQNLNIERALGYKTLSYETNLRDLLSNCTVLQVISNQLNVSAVQPKNLPPPLAKQLVHA
jgi:hypothetical protein